MSRNETLAHVCEMAVFTLDVKKVPFKRRKSYYNYLVLTRYAKL